MGSNRGWLSRLVWSDVVGTTVVVLSTLLLLIMGSAKPSEAQDVASDIVGIPLLPGVGLVSIFFGSWQAFHQGQIAPVPPVSIVIVVDLLIIFVIWEFVHGRRSPKGDVHTTASRQVNSVVGGVAGSVMTSTGRLKRSCFCTVVAVTASTMAVLLRGFLANHANSGDAGDLHFYLLGIPLAPGWFLTKECLNGRQGIRC
jgi:hypothetical protein